VRYKHPRARAGYSGGFGGVGSKPADRAWSPAARPPSDEPDPVPKKLRRLRLRRKSARDREGTGPQGAPIDDILLGVVFILCGFGSLLGAATDFLDWGIVPLLFLGLCSLGAVFLGRGISKRQVLLRAANPEAERRQRTHPDAAALLVARAQGWIILLGGCLAWILVALPALEPFHPLKAALAIALYVGLGISLDVSKFGLRRRRTRKAYTPGRHAARGERWSPARCGVASLTGVALIALGIGLPAMAGPEGGKWVLRIGLCLLVACAFGISLIGIAATSGPWIRRRS